MTNELSSRWQKFVVLLVVINLILFMFWFIYQQQKINQELKENDRELKESNQRLQQKVAELETKSTTEVVKVDAEKIIQTTRKELRTIEDEQANVQYYRQSVAAIASIRVMLTEAYMNEGKFPDRINDLIPDLDAYREGPIRSLVIDTKIPRIEVQLQTPSGEPAGYYYFDAEVDPDSSMVSWNCKTFNDTFLQRALPQCEFVSP